MVPAMVVNRREPLLRGYVFVVINGTGFPLGCVFGLGIVVNYEMPLVAVCTFWPRW